MVDSPHKTAPCFPTYITDMETAYFHCAIFYSKTPATKVVKIARQNFYQCCILLAHIGWLEVEAQCYYPLSATQQNIWENRTKCFSLQLSKGIFVENKGPWIYTYKFAERHKCHFEALKLQKNAETTTHLTTEPSQTAQTISKPPLYLHQESLSLMLNRIGLASCQTWKITLALLANNKDENLTREGMKCRWVSFSLPARLEWMLRQCACRWDQKTDFVFML